MIWVDYVIIAVLSLSILVSVIRGFIREVFSLLAWAAAFFVAATFAADLAPKLSGQIELPSVRMLIAFTGLFVVALLVGGLINFLLGKLVDATGLSATDRFLGAVFGLGRGVIVVLLFVLAAGLTPMPQDPWWQESTMLPFFEGMAVRVEQYLPENFEELIEYRPSLPAEFSSSPSSVSE